MAVKSVIEVDVSDGAFRQFHQLFQQYQEQLKKTPGAWKKISEEVNAVLDKTAEGVEDVEGATKGVEKAAAGTAVAFRQTFINVNNQSSALDKIAKSQSSAARSANSQADHWKRLAHDSGTFAKNIAGATRSLLRWASLTGLISGILGTGGLFGIDRLASSAGNSRRSALGLGVTPGEEKAFGLNFGRVVDPGQFLGGVNEALHDVTKRVGLFGAGLTNNDLAGKDTAGVAAELLPAIKKIADQTPDAMMAQVLRARHLDQFVSLQDFQRIKATPQAEIEQYSKQYQADVNALDLTRQQQKAWQDLQVQLRRAGSTIETVFIRGLTPLAPELEKLSSAFTQAVADFLASPQLKEWIEGLAAGIKEFAGYLQSEKFRQDVRTFVTDVADLAHAIGDAVTTIAGWVRWFKSGNVVSDTKDALANGGVNGQFGDNVNTPGSPAWRAAQDAKRFGQGYAKDDFSWMSPSTWTHTRTMADPEALTNYFRSQGWSDAQIAGILANYKGESAMDAANVGDNGAAAGLGMWRDARREQFRKMFGHDVTAGTPMEQAQFTQWELTHSESSAGAALRNAKTAEEAARIVSTQYERPKDVQGNADLRAKYATSFNQQISKMGGVKVVIENNTGGNAIVTASQLAH